MLLLRVGVFIAVVFCGTGCSIADTACFRHDATCAPGVFFLRGRAVPILPVVSGIFLQLDASSLSAADGTGVATWPDLGPNGYHMPQWGTAPVFKQNQLNGRPVLRFASAGTLSAFRFSGSAAFTDSFTLFVVLRRVGGFGVPCHLIEFGSGACGASFAVDFWITNTGTVELDEQGNATVTNSVATITDTAAHNVILRSNGAAPSTIFHVDGVQTSSLGSVGNYTTSNVIWIGSDCGGAGAQNFDGDIAEIAFYTRTLSTSEVESLDCYAAQKYGTPVGHACP